jgi:hypothetical protein
MRGQWLTHRDGQHRPPVLLSFPAAHDDLGSLEIDVLDAQFEAFLKSQPSHKAT